MKVILFCGGLGVRMREVSQCIPKPMIPVGTYPILLHVMKYYAHFGHREFILCLGYKAQAIQQFFEDCRAGRPSEFIHPADYATLEAIRTDLQDWQITFADTGLHANVGTRLWSVRDLVGSDEQFLANYADVLTDVDLPRMVDALAEQEKVASFLCVRPTYSFHVVSFTEDQTVADIQPVMDSEVWINGGYFVFRREVFDYMQAGDELAEAPFRRLIATGKLLGYRHEGFWAPMDTLKDRQNLDYLFETGQHPWALWKARDPRRLELLNLGH